MCVTFLGKAKLQVPRDHSERIGKILAALEESYTQGKIVQL